MLGIGTIIGIASSIFQAVQALNRPETSGQITDKLFSQLDQAGKGEIDGADLRNAFDKISAATSAKTDQLFSRLDADNDGKITRSEFTESINRLAEQLDWQYMQMRIQGQSSTSVHESNAIDENKLGSLSSITPSTNNNVDMMLQVIKLANAYGIRPQSPQGSGKTGNIAVSG